ncbi:MAG: hypothetical protein JHC33_12695 [Ignisphaera sp.]|jgi:hypothetical protein|nr:hypothetical protein [Ignisphaera sp.]
MTVLLTLTTAGSDTGSFDLYSNLDYAIPFETGVGKATLEAGYSTEVPDGATIVRITSTGDCINSVDITLRLAECDLDGYVEQLTTTTTTTICIPQTIYAGETYYKSGNTALESGLRVNNYASFYPNGTKVFFTQHNNGLAGGNPTGIYDPIISYDLATPWDVSSIIKTGELQSSNSPNQWFSTPAVTSNLTTSYGSPLENFTAGHTFSEDGTKLFTAGKDKGLLQKYTLGTAWDITTMIFDSSTLEYVVITGDSLTAVKFSSDGLIMILLGNSITARYELVSPWDIIGATLIFTSTGNSSDIDFQNGGLYLFTFSGSNLVRKTLGSPYDITTIIETQTLITTVIPQAISPRIVFKDGFKGYISTFNSLEPSIISAFELTCEFDISGTIPTTTTTTTLLL